MEDLELHKAIIMRDFLIELLISGERSDGFIAECIHARACRWGLVSNNELTPAGHAYIKKHEVLKP